jgi:hypothetical protein
MRANGRRLRKLEQLNNLRSHKFIILVEKYPGQPLEEAKEEAGVTSTNKNDYILLMSIADAGLL